MASTTLSFILGAVPVLVFLAALRLMDGYRLVSLRLVALVIVGGGLAAWFCLSASVSLWWLAKDSRLSVYWLLPLLEEVAKALVVLLLFWRHRIGFLVDAAILGFAAGAGFAIVENLYYAAVLEPMPVAVWVVRGFGTAIMHGGVTAIFAVLTQLLTERNRRGLRYCLPGLLLALCLHWLFNRFYLSPLAHTLVVVATLPALLALVFLRSARAMHHWLQQDLDSDLALLHLIQSGEVGRSRTGEFLDDLKRRFEGPVTADMLCYLRLYTELAMRAKGVLMMREHGFEVGGGEGLDSRLAELRYLERSIGRVGMLALRPLLGHDWRNRWQLRLASSLDRG
ncbi:PrsW family glutamic-type intramembrane protease [Parahaliea mediterranea]|uniref:PrsW family intramembrane metalloprotease n=1 Tax=Parahaliea mediterranea TaxID=651086 RepID=A0A939DDW9_9GAMM|nr:PrsW family glutamic-type intramembrane protease [Parahaliea mediterranea]MBN7796448.1 PrsW family intramembrane metalloprotease [Parahaliea mediterranea]